MYDENYLIFVYTIFLFIVKVLEKKHIVRERKTEYVMREKEVLMKLNHPYIIRLYYTFQDPDRLCILETKLLLVANNKLFDII